MADPSDAELAILGTRVNASREQFAEVYDRNAKAHRGKSLKLVQLDALPDEAPFYSALAQARKDSWLAELVQQLVAADMFEVEDQGEVNMIQTILQGVVNPAMGIPNAYLHNEATWRAMRRVCLIDVGGANPNKGTGFLVGPQVVITSWHVVKDLVEPAEEEAPGEFKHRQKEGSQNNLKVLFGQLGGFHAITPLQVAANWLVACKPAHQVEGVSIPASALATLTAAQLAQFQTRLDYALILLAKPVGRERGFYRLETTRRPSLAVPGSGVFLFQHPMGMAMGFSQGANTKLWPPNINTRVHYTANSMSGSSGGLVLDSEFLPVALHQCEIVDPGAAKINGGIPTACIAANNPAFDIVEGVDPVSWIDDTGEPVVGREIFQGAVLDALRGAKRILVVRGESKYGKKFSIKILRQSLGRADHSIIDFNATKVSADARVLAKDILASMGKPDPDLPLAGDGDTAQGAWIRDALFPAFVHAAAEAAGKRTIWLVIDDLDSNPLANATSRLLLEHIYAQIATMPFMRVVLLGLSGNVPGAVPLHVFYEMLAPPTTNEIVDCFERRFQVSNPKNISATDMAHAVESFADTMNPPRMPAVASLILAVLSRP